MTIVKHESLCIFLPNSLCNRKGPCMKHPHVSQVSREALELLTELAAFSRSSLLASKNGHSALGYLANIFSKMNEVGLPLKGNELMIKTRFWIKGFQNTCRARHSSTHLRCQPAGGYIARHCLQQQQQQPRLAASQSLQLSILFSYILYGNYILYKLSFQSGWYVWSHVWVKITSTAGETK